MHVLYHADCDPVTMVPSGTKLTESRDYAEYRGRIACRDVGASAFHLHRIEAQYHEVTYTGREPLGDANTYRSNVDLPVRDSQQLPT